tara:strand:- start:59 stop:853 length:795 start_codon:yes stop_codon:yes gene_type:complete
MANFFKHFPLVNYKFGDEESTALFQNIGTYISILDEMKDNIAFHNKHFIGEYERPDTLSYKLYGTTEFYWTFYYLNPHIRESGWPISIQELYTRVKKDYPNRVVTTNSDISKILLPGTAVRGTVSSSIGTIVKRNLDMGQLIIRSEDNFGPSISEDGTVTASGEEIIDNTDGAEATSKATSISETTQYDSIHHYEDSTGEWQYPTPNTGSSGGIDTSSVSALWTAITVWNRFENKNNALREIKILTPNVASQVQAEFNKLLKQG